MSHNANSPASPCKGAEWQVPSKGLTKREHFIAMAMQGLCASVDLTVTHIKDISRDAVTIADQTMDVMEATENGTN